jgi:histidinol-phosphate aminotransferase
MSRYIRENIAALSAYVPGEQPADPAVIKLNTNENPYPPSPAIAPFIQQFVTEKLRLYPDPVAQSLRQAVAELHGTTIDHVFCGNGSDEVLALCLRAFVPDHGRIGYFDPSYSLYPVLADIAGIGVEPVPLQADFTVPALAAAYDVPLFFWTNPNAPTSLQCAIASIQEYADRSGGVVVVDEAYVDFADDTALPLALSAPNVLMTRTLSKSYSLAGIRLGYAVGDPALIHALYKIKDAYNLDRLTQEIGRLALVDQVHMRANVARIKNTRARVAAELARKGWRVWPSQTNFLWIAPATGTAAEWYQRWRDQNVLVRHFSAPRTRDYLRVTIGTDPQMDVFLGLV